MPLVFELRDQDVFKMMFAWHLRKAGSTSTYIMTLLHLLLRRCRTPFSFLTYISSFTFQLHVITVENILLSYNHGGREELVKNGRIFQRTEVIGGSREQCTAT